MERQKAGLSQRGLAKLSRINPAIISRMERADRGASGPEQVLSIASALGLDDERSDSLLASSGFWPRAILHLGPRDETLLAVARVLARKDGDGASKERFRSVIALLVEEWQNPYS